MNFLQENVFKNFLREKFTVVKKFLTASGNLRKPDVVMKIFLKSFFDELIFFLNEFSIAADDPESGFTCVLQNFCILNQIGIL